ncbi:MAG TPA: type IV pilus assembly protein PilM [Solirubrobacteraceae bacterium]|jgi:type IV pilus assembly protein PilM|nr:type IV pilus assembly protein PilM [Solirubrobacteraceae bacterium]
MPSLPNPTLRLNLGRRSGADIVGLDIQPGHVAAVQARVNGSVVVKHAAGAPLPADTVREGEVLDEGVLSEALRALFADSRLSRRVRLGVANQRTVLRTLELPPVTDRKELAAAVRFQAQDQVPMPLSNAVLDFHPLGVFDTPDGPRQRVVLVAAQRDMIQRLLAAVRNAGLRPEGIDLSAFALIRSLYRPDPEHIDRVLYLNVDGLTNMAIAEGTTCRFTRVVGGGIEAMASELAERRSIPLVEARELIISVDLSTPPEAEVTVSEPEPVGVAEDEQPTVAAQDPQPDPTTGPAYSTASPSEVASPEPEADVRAVLDNGIREIAGEVRNSLDFHRSQEGGGEVSRVVLSGSALDLPGFADSLQEQLGVQVERESVRLDEQELGGVSVHRLAIAAGLAVEEVPQ